MADPSPSPSPFSPSAAPSTGPGKVLQFVPFQSIVEDGFWRRLSALKLDTLRTDESPIPITGFYAPCAHSSVSNHMTLSFESLPPDSEIQNSVEIPKGNRNKCPIPGTLINTNTLESFKTLDRDSLIKSEAKKILEDILSGKVEEDPSLLLRFIIISFADLKKWGFYYWCAFPALVLDPPAKLLKIKPALFALSSKEANSLKEACNEWRNSSETTDVPFFLVCISSNLSVTLRPLKDFEECKSDSQKILFGFYDPCPLPANPGWPLRNYLSFISLKWNIETVNFFCYRETGGFPNLDISLIGVASVSVQNAWRDPQFVPKAVGWELQGGKLSPRYISLAKSMDPKMLAESAAELNLKLMRWRTLPSLDLEMLHGTKCLLLGVGTLGCEVARVLMAWGVRKMTLVDSGRVSMSNPVRQSLYTFENCLNGGEFKALAAAKSLKQIFPSVETEGIVMPIPMPGHPVSEKETESVIESCKKLEELINSHDVVFLLTDTRESRWLPTLICSNLNKIAITAALGFDSYLVMRHGAGPTQAITGDNNLNSEMETNNKRLGCYFCNDVVAPIDSISNRTLDQQCTVTRPGLAPIASALAVELLVGVLHHPERINAQGEIGGSIVSSTEQPLGILPHQIRGSISQASQLTLLGHSSDSCTACSQSVVTEYRKRGLEFVLEAINHPTYLEDLTGLTELMKSVGSFQLDWVDDDDVDDFDDAGL
ncbi:hypothetical protein LUZ60_008321 [Juncus effusus]|nr:hypothetical protein LUZ60_008321 [Juncus effusus]